MEMVIWHAEEVAAPQWMSRPTGAVPEGDLRVMLSWSGPVTTRDGPCDPWPIVWGYQYPSELVRDALNALRIPAAFSWEVHGDHRLWFPAPMASHVRRAFSGADRGYARWQRSRSLWDRWLGASYMEPGSKPHVQLLAEVLNL